MEFTGSDKVQRADPAFGQNSDPIFKGSGRFDSGNIDALGG
jgi:hypothetical protein